MSRRRPAPDPVAREREGGAGRRPRRGRGGGQGLAGGGREVVDGHGRDTTGRAVARCDTCVAVSRSATVPAHVPGHVARPPAVGRAVLRRRERVGAAHRHAAAAAAQELPLGRLLLGVPERGPHDRRQLEHLHRPRLAVRARRRRRRPTGTRSTSTRATAPTSGWPRGSGSTPTGSRSTGRASSRGPASSPPRAWRSTTNVVRAMRAKGIQPLITLNHWDYPQWVLDQGGWTSTQDRRRLRGDDAEDRRPRSARRSTSGSRSTRSSSTSSSSRATTT